MNSPLASPIAVRNNIKVNSFKARFRDTGQDEYAIALPKEPELQADVLLRGSNMAFAYSQKRHDNDRSGDSFAFLHLKGFDFMVLCDAFGVGQHQISAELAEAFVEGAYLRKEAITRTRNTSALAWETASALITKWKGDGTFLQPCGATFLCAAIFPNGSYHISSLGNNAAYMVFPRNGERRTERLLAHNMLPIRIGRSIIEADIGELMPDKETFRVARKLLNGAIASFDTWATTEQQGRAEKEGKLVELLLQRQDTAPRRILPAGVGFQELMLSCSGMLEEGAYILAATTGAVKNLKLSVNEREEITDASGTRDIADAAGKTKGLPL